MTSPQALHVLRDGSVLLLTISVPHDASNLIFRWLGFIVTIDMMEIQEDENRSAV